MVVANTGADMDMDTSAMVREISTTAAMVSGIDHTITGRPTNTSGAEHPKRFISGISRCSQDPRAFMQPS